MSRLTDTQLVILSAASQRDDRGVELPANVKGEAARKAADKLIRAGLLEEVGAGGLLAVKSFGPFLMTYVSIDQAQGIMRRVFASVSNVNALLARAFS
jgi:hypothetical protein